MNLRYKREKNMNLLATRHTHCKCERAGEDFKKIYEEYDIVGAKINKYIQYVETNWNDPQSK